MTNTPRNPEDIHFCLDENISYRVAVALTLAGAPVIHISEAPGLGSQTRGRSGADDETVAQWCAENDRVLITCDNDFRGRWVRSGLLARAGLETIVFGWQPPGHEQLTAIEQRYKKWTSELAQLPAGHRVWLQHRRGKLTLQKEWHVDR